MQVRNEKARRFLLNMRKKPGVSFEQHFPRADRGALALLRKMLAFDPAGAPLALQLLCNLQQAVRWKQSAHAMVCAACQAAVNADCVSLPSSSVEAAQALRCCTFAAMHCVRACTGMLVITQDIVGLVCRSRTACMHGLLCF